MTNTTQDLAVLPRAAAVMPGGADIRFVSFVRRLPDGTRKHAPIDFPVEEMVTWAQVVDLWGGGEYQAIAKTENHRVVAHYPTGGKWMAFAGDPKPMVRPLRAPRQVDDPCAPILPAGALPRAPTAEREAHAAAHGEPLVAPTAPLPERAPAEPAPTREVAADPEAAPAPARETVAAPEPAAPGPAVSIRDVELGERAGLLNPFDIRLRIQRLIREGVLSEVSILRAADGAYLLSREAAVLITLRLKLKRRVQLAVVGALLAGTRPPPAPLAQVPPLAPSVAPIVLNGEGRTVTFDGHSIPLHSFRGAMVMVAGELDAPLGYEAGVIAQQLTSEWADEVRDGVHFMVLRGTNLREFKRGLDATRTNLVASKASHLTILTEAGIDRVCLLTKKPAGVRLRAFIADHVLPKLRRGEPVGTGGGGTQVPLVSAMAPYTSGPARPSPADTPKFHPVLVGRLDETSRRLAAVENLGRQVQARLGDLETRLSGASPSGPCLA